MGASEEIAAHVQESLGQLHRAAGVIRAYLAAYTESGGPPTSLPPPELEGMGMNSTATKHTEVLDAFLSYTRYVVAGVESGALRPKIVASSSDPRSDTRPLTLEAFATGEAAQLRGVVALLTDELATELADQDGADAHRRRLADLLEALRLDGSLVQVYSGRIRELLSLLGHGSDDVATEALTSIAASTAAAGGSSSNGGPSTTVTAKAVATELGRYTVVMKDRLDRATAEVAKLQADRTALLAENALLFRRVGALESRMSKLTESSSSTLRELDRQRTRLADATAKPGVVAATAKRNAASLNASTSRRATTPSPAPASRLAGGDGGSAATLVDGGRSIKIGDVTIDREVAAWMSDMYLALASDPETAGMVPSSTKQRGAKRVVGGTPIPPTVATPPRPASQPVDPSRHRQRRLSRGTEGRDGAPNFTDYVHALREGQDSEL